jgi:Bifunctional DNA primase/polymerase, N-terminal/Primase C terminal 2 (PriCT-2)
LPRDKGWGTNPYDPIKVTERCIHENRNFGACVPDGWVVLDEDPRNFPVGRNSLEEFCRTASLELKSAPRQMTGGGGHHYFFRMPKGARVTNSLPAFPGVDFKTLGGYILLDTSIHPQTKRAYGWDVFNAELADAPDLPSKALHLIRRPDRADGAQAGGGEHTSEEIAQMLDRLDVLKFGDNDTWFRLMAACHHASAGEAREEFLDWSEGDAKYSGKREENGYRWDSLHSDSDVRPITARTLYRILHDAGSGDAIPRSDAEDVRRADRGGRRPHRRRA